MIEVQLNTAGREVVNYPQGVYAIPDEHGWVSIMDEDGLALAVYYKDRVLAITLRGPMKAGEKQMSENPG